MKNLPSLYASVIARRPDLAVPHLAYDSTPHWRDTVPRGWCWYGDPCNEETESTAAAMILAQWVEALPKHHVLANMGTNPRGGSWLVYEMGIGGDYTDPNRAEAMTTIEALADFYLNQ